MRKSTNYIDTTWNIWNKSQMYHCLVLFPFLSILSNSNLRCFSSVLSFTLCTLQQQVISLDLGKALVVSGEKKEYYIWLREVFLRSDIFFSYSFFNCFLKHRLSLLRRCIKILKIIDFIHSLFFNGTYLQYFL